MSKLQFRLHASPERIGELRTDFWDNETKDRFYHIGKPIGFWYAIDDAWLDWLVFSCRKEECQYFYDVDISKANVLKIKTAEQLKRFHDTYNIPFFIPGEHIIDWDSVAEEYDGIEINPYQAEFRFEYHWYNCWDVPSGAVWAVDKISLKEVPYTHPMIKPYEVKRRKKYHEHNRKDCNGMQT